MRTLKITAIGNGLGVILPKAVLAWLDVKKGDPIHVTEAPGGGLRLTANDPDFERQMGLGEEVIREHRNAIRALAK